MNIFPCLDIGMGYLDNDDLKAIKRILEDTLNKKIDEKLGFKLNNLPTREEFYKRFGKILEILRSLRKAQAYK